VRAWNRLIVAVLMVVAVFAASALVVVADDVCYTDVRISGTGNAWVDGNHAFSYMANGRPEFNTWYVISPTQKVYVFVYWNDVGDGEWTCYVKYYEWDVPGHDHGVYSERVRYFFINSSDSASPPGTGWIFDDHYDSGGEHEPFVVSAPTMSGGQPCTSPNIVITGLGPNGAILDKSLDLAEGEGPPLAGLCLLAAVYGVGDLVTGACSIEDEAGRTVRGAYIHVYIYSVDIEPRPEVKTLLDHWVVHYDQARDGYGYNWDTSGMASGYYDVYLSFGDGKSHTCRIQLIEPTE